MFGRNSIEFFHLLHQANCAIRVDLSNIILRFLKPYVNFPSLAKYIFLQTTLTIDFFQSTGKV